MKKDIIYPELSYKITGLCFRVHQELGRFCRERQYAERLEKALKQSGMKYKREADISSDVIGGNRADFVIENRIVLDVKAKNFITKEDYFQMLRYLKSSRYRLGLIVNFRNAHLKPKRVLNSEFNLNHSHINSHHSSRPKGFIALTSILIIGALILTISIGLSLRSIGETQISLGEHNSHRALALANLCAESALMKLESILNYVGNETLIVDGQTCDIMSVQGSGNLNRTVKTQSTVSGFTRKVKVVVSQISPVMQISSWEEVGDH